jgi:WD40 repeat protein
VWSYPDLIPVRTFKDRWPGIVRVALSAGGDRIAVGSHAPSISVLEPQTGELLYTLDEADTAVLFTHEDVSVLLSLAESAVKVWDAESGDLVRSLPHAGVEHLTVASDGGLLASGDSRQVKVWTLKDGTLITTFSIPAAHALRTLALAPDGGSLITVAWELDASTGAKNTVLTYWDILEGSPMYSVTLSDLLLDQIAISPQGGYLVGGTSRCSLGPLGRRCAYLWNRGDPLTTATLYTPAVTSLAFAPQGELVIGSHDELYVWRIP